MTPRMIRRFALAVSLSALMAPVAAAQDTPVAQMPAGTYTLDLNHTSVLWRVSHAGLSNYTGRFNDVSGTLDFDPSDPAASQLTVTIDPLSIDTDYPNAETKNFNDILASDPKYFNASAWPEITFTTTGIDLRDDGRTGQVRGDLTLLGQTHPLILEVTLNGARADFFGRPTFGFSATTIVDRAQHGMTALLPNIGQSVEVIIETEFNKLD